MSSAPNGNGNGSISRGNMTIILSSAGLVMLAFGAFITQQNSAVDRQIADVKTTLDKTLRKDEHEEFKLRLDRDIGLIREEQQRRSGSIVPRTEHEARWASTDKDLRLLAERLNELRTATSSTYTIRDEVHRMQTEVSEMRRLLNDRKTSP